MPYKSPKPCAYHGCPNLTSERFCTDHAKQDAKHYDKFRRDPVSKKKYGNNWRRLRAAFIQANPVCELCWQEGKSVPATTVHHRKELSEGGGNDWENLQSLCAGCHSSLHMRKRNSKRRRV